MNALSELAMMTQSTRHSDSLQAEYDSCKELLRLCPGDNMGVRATVPSVLLRLGKDQECYDFMKWFAQTLNNRNYDWFKTEGYLNIKNADIFEDIDYLAGSRVMIDLSFLICMMILKIRVALDLGKLSGLQSEIDRMSEATGVKGTLPPRHVQ